MHKNEQRDTDIIIYINMSMNSTKVQNLWRVNELLEHRLPSNGKV